MRMSEINTYKYTYALTYIHAYIHTYSITNLPTSLYRQLTLAPLNWMSPFISSGMVVLQQQPYSAQYHNKSNGLCIHTQIHTYIHTHVHAYIHTYIHTHIHTYIHTYLHTYTHTYIHTLHSYIHTDTLSIHHTYIHTYVHTHTILSHPLTGYYYMEIVIIIQRVLYLEFLACSTRKQKKWMTRRSCKVSKWVSE